MNWESYVVWRMWNVRIAQHSWKFRIFSILRQLFSTLGHLTFSVWHFMTPWDITDVFFVVNTQFNELNTAESIRSSYRRRVTFNSSVGRFLNKYCIIQRPYWFSFISSFCFCFVFKDFYSRFLWSYFNLFLTWHKNNKQNLLNYTEVTIENHRMSSVELYLFRLMVVVESPPEPFVVHSTAGFGVSSRISWHFRKLSKFALGNDMTWSNRESLGDDFSQENRPNLTL